MNALGLSTGKTVWSTTKTTFTGARMLSSIDDKLDLAAWVEDQVTRVRRSLFTTQPAWCSFQGVTCGGGIMGVSTYASVTEISIRSLSLIGSLPSSIGNFGSLTKFDVAANDIGGVIPSSISLLTSLVHLDMSSNILQRDVPSSIGDMSTLQILDLSSNFLSGTIPTSFGTNNKQMSLRVLNMHFNYFTGTIPNSIGELSKLEKIGLNFNILSGSIPSSIGALTALRTVSLHSNSLVGTIPAQISLLQLLTTLDLHSNYLSMGGASFLSPSLFPSSVLNGVLILYANCLAFTSSNPSQSTTPTQCLSPTGRRRWQLALIILLFPNLSFRSLLSYSRVTHRDPEYRDF